MKKMLLLFLPLLIICFQFSFHSKNSEQTWIRINQLGYKPNGVKVAVWCSKESKAIEHFQIVDATTNESLYEASAGKAFGAYGPFVQTFRLNFSAFKTLGKYKLKVGDTPTDPHSAFTHIKGYPINGGLVDGPVYRSIFNNLKGIRLYKEDGYAPFQSALAVYHDDFGDYSTNEPTMDGTASLIYLLAAKEAEASKTTNAKPKQ